MPDNPYHIPQEWEENPDLAPLYPPPTTVNTQNKPNDEEILWPEPEKHTRIIPKGYEIEDIIEPESSISNILMAAFGRKHKNDVYQDPTQIPPKAFWRPAPTGLITINMIWHITLSLVLIIPVTGITVRLISSYLTVKDSGTFNIESVTRASTVTLGWILAALTFTLLNSIAMVNVMRGTRGGLRLSRFLQWGTFTVLVAAMFVGIILLGWNVSLTTEIIILLGLTLLSVVTTYLRPMKKWCSRRLTPK